jgi:hypothetical protein
MFEQIIENNNAYNQQGFSISSFTKKASNLAYGHITILNSIDYLNTCYPELVIGRSDLIVIWNDAKIPLYTKILITFWWGNLSHKDQAPKFYKKQNLDKLQLFSEELNSELIEINKPIKNFNVELQNLYNSLKLNHGKYKLSGINTAFFTKILQFGISNPIQPIIADKWSIRAILADMIDQNYNYQSVFRINHPPEGNLKVSFKGSTQNEFEKYFKMLEYFNLRCTQLQITPLQLEEIMFGFGNAMHIPNNPRVIAENIIIQRP